MALTGRDILRLFVEEDKEATFKYNQLCGLLISFDQWSEKSKLEFLTQFQDAYRDAGSECSRFVECLCTIQWKHWLIPKQREDFVLFLARIAISEVFHLRIIFETMFDHLRPDLSLSPLPNALVESEVPEELRQQNLQTQAHIYELAISGISSVLCSNPTCQHVLLRAAEFKFPHVKAPAHQFLTYLRNMVILADKCPSIAQEIWILIINRMLQIDAIISRSTKEAKGEFSVNESSIFAMEEDDMKDDAPTRQMEIELTEKLDKAMMIVLARISKGKKDISNGCNAEETKWVENLELNSTDILFEHLWPAFCESALAAHDVQSVPFIWFYLCSFEEKYTNYLLKFLWNTVTLPSFVPNSWKKSQNAANFLGAFIARANYIKFDKAFSWMKKMAHWCNEYINAAGLRKNVEGCLQHGAFYAVVQALLFTFSFRYKEFVEYNCVKEVHSWGLARIIHSQFQPLRFISRIISLGFATISRQLQIVYCVHIMDENGPTKTPIEHYLPFSILQLPVSSSIVIPFIRKFQPAEEDMDHISIDFNEDSRKRYNSSGDNDFDFMEDDEDVPQMNENQSSFAAVLSTSPYSAFASTMTKAKYITNH
ncbi:hypothetical protein FO519_007482 [Halicephalobus sp. NKZ332]|nr:hypothetical protein FO519_007482 [Halicephalobus sp. NKZ332]